MGWETVRTHTDPDTEVVVEKEERQRYGHRNPVRYLVKITPERYIYLSTKQLFDMIDTLDDLCDQIADGKF